MDDRGVLGAVRTMETEKRRKEEKGADKIHSRISPVPCFCLVIYLVVFFFANTTPLRSFQEVSSCCAFCVHTYANHGLCQLRGEIAVFSKKRARKPAYANSPRGWGAFTMEPNTPELQYLYLLSYRA